MTPTHISLVTGGARGIGAAVVRHLAERGHHVYALDACAGEDGGTPYPQARYSDLQEVVQSCPDRVTPVVADVRDADAMQKVVADLVAHHGRLDTVVAAAAVIAGGSALWDTEAEVLDLLWQTDVVGVWNTVRAAVPQLVASAGDGHPSFVAVASTAGERGLWHLGAYCMVKHAVVGLVRGLAADLRDSGVSVSAVSPGSTDTDMLAATAALYGLQDTSSFAQAQAIGRLLSADEVAAVVEFACTRAAAVHGSVVHADGGFCP
jgi:SDR family mycofactocin-dependent oxidoreductase